MRQGNNARLIYDAANHLVAIATGADAAAEHECGSRPLQQALCTQFDDEAALVARLAAGERIDYPQLSARKRITKRAPGLQFIHIPARGADGQPHAVLGYSRQNLAFSAEELRFRSPSVLNEDPNVAGAWDEESFAIRVRGERHVTALRDFHDALQAGKCLFAGTFLQATGRLSGVVIGNEEHFDDATRQAMTHAQALYESELRLKARDDSRVLLSELRQAAGVSPSGRLDIGHLWVRWADERETEVVYGLNPGYRVKADYFGPYRREELLAWARAGFAYHLRPASRETASV